ncbi:MAG: hypothetical protein LBC72_05435 [Spirochaetaceae bacterium]|jgi:hypothetical protein|nr:hypothetical protein [Spirochaetaceae bacterium]
MRETNDERERNYDEKVKSYEAELAAFQKHEAELLGECRKEPVTAACKLFRLAGEGLDACSKYLVINGIYHSIFGVRSEDTLGEARKAVLKAIIYIENIVTAKVDALFSDYENFLDELNLVGAEQKLFFIRKLGLTIDLIKAAYGDNTKWKWLFVDIEGRFAVIAKNLLDFRKAQTNSMQSEDYAAIANHVRMVKHLLNRCADLFLERYELSTKRAEDLRLAINHLAALQRVKLMLNDKEDMELLKKKMETWQARLDGTPRPAF